MKLLTRAGAGLVAVLVIATTVPGAAQSPAPAQPQTSPATPVRPEPAPPVEEEPEPADTGRGRRGRSTRAPRTSNREAPAATPGGTDQARVPRDAGPTLQTLTLTSSLLGGYDDNLTAGMGSGPGVAPSAMASGSTASLDGTLGYYRGNRLRSFRMDSTGYVLAYPDYFDRPVGGGVVLVDAQTSMGRANTFAVSERVGYEPLLNVFSQGGTGAPELPELDVPAPTAGLYERRSLSSNSRLSLETRWGRRDTTTVAYGYGLRNFADDASGDNTAHSVTTTYRRLLGTAVKARADYRYTNAETTLDSIAGERPIRTHRLEGGTDVEQTLSRRRSLSWTFTAGAARVESIGTATNLPYSAWTPVGTATMRFAYSSRWTLDASYRRGYTLLQGVTNDVYATNTATVTTSGFVATRTSVLVGATYGKWRTPVASGVASAFDVYGGLVQVSQFLTDTVAVTASYNYYHHLYSNPELLPTDFPPAYDRNAVRVGITVRFPLVGMPSGQMAAPRQR